MKNEDKFCYRDITYNSLTSNFKSSFIEVQGHKMFLDTKDILHLSTNKIWEPIMTELVKREIKKGNVVLDLGSHIGYYTLIFAKLVGNKGKVFAFEPAPNNFTLLKKNVTINSYQNVVLIQKAVSNETNKCRLFLSESNSADNRIYNSNDNCKSIEVKTIKLDDYFKNYNRIIDFVKMDIQGTEWKAIQGMFALLQKNKSLKLITEFAPWWIKMSGFEPINYLKLLLKCGFKLLYDINELEKKIIPTNITVLIKKYSPEEQNYTNLLCLKNNVMLKNL